MVSSTSVDRRTLISELHTLVSAFFLYEPHWPTIKTCFFAEVTINRLLCVCHLELTKFEPNLTRQPNCLFHLDKCFA